MSKQNIKKQVEELVAARDRTGKKPLTADERIQILNEIYDGLLFFWKQCVLTGAAKGTGAISHQLERARLEMYDLQRTSSDSKDNHGKRTVGWDHDPELEEQLMKLIPES